MSQRITPIRLNGWGNGRGAEAPAQDVEAPAGLKRETLAEIPPGAGTRPTEIRSIRSRPIGMGLIR